MEALIRGAHRHEEEMVVRSISMRTAAALALLLTVAPVALEAQTPGSPAQPSPEVQGWIVELQELQGRLGPIQEEALQDQALRTEQEEVSLMVQRAIAENPELSNLSERAADLQTRAQAAVQANDQAQLERIMGEAERLEQQVAAAQTEALARPEIAARAEAFQARLQGRMIEIEPQAEVMLQRFTELQNRLVDAMTSDQ